MSKYFIAPLVLLAFMGWALFLVNINYHPKSDKCYWSGFRAGLKASQESDSDVYYNKGYNDCMEARKRP